MWLPDNSEKAGIRTPVPGCRHGQHIPIVPTPRLRMMFSPGKSILASGIQASAGPLLLLRAPGRASGAHVTFGQDARIAWPIRLLRH
ncbi:hypothetical protein C9E81_20175 [Paracoccus alkanivorans]|uniref:Uncharacterized protein n=1 Tax=Paracoccus alkanivorans TaxID=2116655 RepID=A0A3M0M2A1_9RHOB|nr:hypothetical protein C9E81_20175 [Paracoccus alkanivorans]